MQAPSKIASTTLGRVRSTWFERATWRVDGRGDVEVGVVHRPPAVGIVPIRGQGRDIEVLLVTQHRPAVERSVVEIVAGKVDPGEDALTTALRELREEAGLHAWKGELLTPEPLLVSPGYSTETMTLFLATDLEPTPRRPEDAHIQCEWLPLSDALVCIDSGEIRDAKTVAALLLVDRRISAQEVIAQPEETARAVVEGDSVSTGSAAGTLAPVLEGLARHLQAHPHLSHVNVQRTIGRVDLQVSTHPSVGEPDATTALVAWAESLPDHEITVRVIEGKAYVFVTTDLEGFPVQVWSTVPGLAAVLRDPGALILDQLRAFAAIAVDSE